jgi:hypothetical protein
LGPGIFLVEVRFLSGGEFASPGGEWQFNFVIAFLTPLVAVIATQSINAITLRALPTRNFKVLPTGTTNANVIVIFVLKPAVATVDNIATTTAMTEIDRGAIAFWSTTFFRCGRSINSIFN